MACNLSLSRVLDCLITQFMFYELNTILSRYTIISLKVFLFYLLFCRWFLAEEKLPTCLI